MIRLTTTSKVSFSNFIMGPMSTTFIKIASWHYKTAIDGSSQKKEVEWRGGETVYDASRSKLTNYTVDRLSLVRHYFVEWGHCCFPLLMYVSTAPPILTTGKILLNSRTFLVNRNWILKVCFHADRR